MSKLKLNQKAITTAAPRVVTTTNAVLEAKCVEHQTVSAKFAQFEARKKALAKEILADTVPICGEKGTLILDDYQVTDTHGVSVQISEQKLITLGVSAKIIEKAKVKVPFSYPRITRKKVTLDDSNASDALAFPAPPKKGKGSK